MNLTRLRLGVAMIAAASVTACVSTPDRTASAADDRLYTTGSYRSEIVTETVADLAGERALFVFDIDNTLLENPPGQFLGSAQWYSWQDELPDDDARKVGCLLDVQGVAYHMGQMVPTENGGVVPFVAGLQASGHDVIALTARGPEYRYATERELERATIDFSKSLPRDNAGFPGRYRPVESPSIQRPRDASYQNGIAMMAGQHKGAALVDLLARLGADGDYDVIVVFDDDEENTRDLIDSFTRDPRRAIVFHYTAVDASYDQDDIADAVRGQQEIAEAYSHFARDPGCDI